MPEELEEVTIRLANERVQFVGCSRYNADHPVTFDYAPPIGDGDGYNGLELLLMSLAGCSSTALVYLLRKMGKTVLGFEMRANGIRSKQPPIKFDQILLEFVVYSQDAKDPDVERAIQLAEGSVCPVWQMIKNNVEVLATFKIAE